LVFARGFTQVDHFQPGCNVARPKVRPPKETRSTCPLSNVRLSSGCDTVFFWILFINCVALVSGVVQEPFAKLASVTRRLFSFSSNTQCRTLCGIGQSFRRLCSYRHHRRFHQQTDYHSQRRPESEPTSMMATALGQLRRAAQSHDALVGWPCLTAHSTGCGLWRAQYTSTSTATSTTSSSGRT